MARLYVDEDTQIELAERLRVLGHDVLTVSEDGRANQRISDPAVLRRATTLGRAVLTCNRGDYKRLHRLTGGNHAGIVICSQVFDLASMAETVDTSLRDCEDLTGQLLNVYRGQPSSG